jgi:PadR family transcriptional regulator, regulatory protein PadR
MGNNRGSITNNPPDLLRGTLDLLILRTLANGPQHGYAIAQRLRIASEEMLQVGESALYPSLQRLLAKGLVKAAWGASENNRRARFYTISATGKKHLATEGAGFARLLAAMTRVMEQG